MKTRFAAFLLCVGVVVFIAGCSSNDATQNTAETPADKAQTAPDKAQTAKPDEKAPPEVAAAPPMFVPPSLKDQQDTFEPPSSFFTPEPPQTPLPLFVPPSIQSDTATQKKILKGNKGGKPLHMERGKLGGIPVYKLVIDLDDPQTLITIALPNGATEANSATVHHGDEGFESFCKRNRGAMLANGTFFSKDEEKRVMGNLVSDGKFRKYSQWENYGTTLGIKANNELEMVTARLEGQPRWENYWFSLTCGPRLVREGKVSIAAEDEGFQDSHVFTIGPRSAIGFNRAKHQIIYCAFLRGLSLEREAELMKSAGCEEAMNLDGGASRGLAAEGKVILKPGRALTNVLVVYDAAHPAPSTVAESWNRFQDGERPKLPNALATGLNE